MLSEDTMGNRSRCYAIFVLCLMFILTVARGPAAAATQLEAALTNDDVVKLCKSGLSEPVIVAKIKEAPDVRFDLDTDSLIKLKQQKVSDAVVAAMLDRSSRPAHTDVAAVPVAPGLVIPTAVPKSDVILVTKSGELNLTSLVGSATSTYAYIKMLYFMDYPGLTAKIRTSDHRPSVLVNSQSDPRNQYFVVKTEVNQKDGDRSVKIGSGFLRAKGINQPDADWTVPYQASEERPGIWRISLQQDLERGEYGVYYVGKLYEFGVD